MRGNVKCDEKVCGACAFFHSEDTDGWGFCAVHDDELGEFMHCSDMCEDDYVSIEEMRHHMAVLLQYRRCVDRGFLGVRCPDEKERHDAAAFAYRYMKAFSKL